jgi:cupin superfamily acireductone dioxygenase involved in methionine salvage
VTVTGGAQSRSVVVSAAKELLRIAKRHGYRPTDVISLIEELA